MLQHIKIQNFKGIKSCKVKDLRKINLFIGKNDSGKSTILEAAYYSLLEYYSAGLQKIMARRTNVFTSGSELWFKYEVAKPIVLSTRINGMRLNLTLRISGNEIHCEMSGSGGRDPRIKKRAVWKFAGNTYMGVNLSLSIGIGIPINQLPITSKAKDRLTRFISKMSLIDCTLKSRTSDIEATLGELKISGKDKQFGMILEDVYGKGKDWEFLPHRDKPSETRLAIRESGRLTFFSDFGDGLRYGLGILGSAMSSNNTAIFIEEIESHQHIGSLRKLIKNLVEISRKNGLQLFLSTHKFEVWNSLARGVYVDDVETEKKEFRCYVVEKDSNSGEVTAMHTDDITKINRVLSTP